MARTSWPREESPWATSVIPSAGSGPSPTLQFHSIRLKAVPGYLFGSSDDVRSYLEHHQCVQSGGTIARAIQSALAYADNPANGSGAADTGIVHGRSPNHQCTLPRGANTTIAAWSHVAGGSPSISPSTLRSSAPRMRTCTPRRVASNSGWVTVGSWTVTGRIADGRFRPSRSSVSGLSPNFTFTVSDSSSEGEHRRHDDAPHHWFSLPIWQMRVICSMTASPATIGGFMPMTESTTQYQGHLGPRQTLQNSQCAIGYTVMITSGNSVLFTINVVLKVAGFSVGSRPFTFQALEPNTSSGMGCARDMDSPLKSGPASHRVPAKRAMLAPGSGGFREPSIGWPDESKTREHPVNRQIIRGAAPERYSAPRNSQSRICRKSCRSPPSISHLSTISEASPIGTSPLHP